MDFSSGGLTSNNIIITCAVRSAIYSRRESNIEAAPPILVNKKIESQTLYLYSTTQQSTKVTQVTKGAVKWNFLLIPFYSSKKAKIISKEFT